MRAVLLDVPAHLLEERRRLGLDSRDEMWEGVLHMVPPPAGDHQGLSTELLLVLGPIAKLAGLVPRMETGLFDPAIAGFHDYRVPDQLYADPALRTQRGIDGPAALVVELRSPGDDTYDKLDYYHRLGVGEVLIVHPTTRALELHRRTPSGWD
jgi:Uma2 family endonuclease